MTDRTLHGNGAPCPACELRRERQDTSAVLREHVPCNNCGAVGRVAIPDEEIVAREVAWARRFYWPERERRWGHG